MLAALAAVTLALAGCTSAGIVHTDARRAVILAPYQRNIFWGLLSFSEGQVFYPGQVNGERVWCSATPAFFALAEATAICASDPAGPDRPEGWFRTAIIVRPAAVWRFDVDVPYQVAAGPRLPPR